MKYRMSTKMGDIVVDSDVIATYAGTIAVEGFGIVGMASVNMRDGIVNLLKKDHYANGIRVTVEEDKISLEFHVVVAYGVSIQAVSNNLIETVKYKVQDFTGATVDKVDVFVEGIRVID